MMLVGTKLVNWITGFLIFLALAVGFMSLTCVFIFQSSIKTEHIVITGICSVFISAVLTYYLTKNFVKLGVGALGAWTLLSLSFLLVPLCGLSNGVNLAIYIVMSIIGTVVGIYKSEAVKVYLTSFIGSFFVIRGISLYAGGFPNEFALISETPPPIDFPVFIGYCVGIVVLFILSVVF